VHTVKNAQKKRMQNLHVKTMLIAFFDAEGIIHHEFAGKVNSQQSSLFGSIEKAV
jgi:hypothetical protein